MNKLWNDTNFRGIDVFIFDVSYADSCCCCAAGWLVWGYVHFFEIERCRRKFEFYRESVSLYDAEGGLIFPSLGIKIYHFILFILMDQSSWKLPANL